jgi:hypothetical protein
MAIAAHCLARNPELAFKVLGKRAEISLEAIRSCALEGDLGFEADCRFSTLSGPAVLFGYRCGVKARWAGTDSAGKRLIRWIAGKTGGECWRQSLLRTDHRRVYVAEGETDTLTALSLGLEDEDGESLIVGLAGAQILPDPKPFARKGIVIVSDPDKAGTASAEKLASTFGVVASEVAIISLNAPSMEGGVH